LLHSVRIQNLINMKCNEMKCKQRRIGRLYQIETELFNKPLALKSQGS